jgi:hypothetical protein
MKVSSKCRHNQNAKEKLIKQDTGCIIWKLKRFAYDGKDLLKTRCVFNWKKDEVIMNYKKKNYVTQEMETRGIK